MKIETKDFEVIRGQFASLQSKDDLLQLLNYGKKLVYGDSAKPFLLKSISYYANPEFCKKRYQTFTIKKKSGKLRTIHAPVKGLKALLRSLNLILHCIHESHDASTGFELDRSIVDNARKHVGRHYVYNIDLKDFFHSFDRNRVKLVLMNEPYNLNGRKEPLAFFLASLCTHPIEINKELKIVLPQGSPVSPILTNILCKRLDKRLSALAKRFGATYSRYADDITFSSHHNLFVPSDNPLLNQEGHYTDFLSELHRLIKEEKLEINASKTRLQKSAYRQEATGLVVNQKVNVQRRYVKQIRMWLYYWEKYGYDKADQIFKRDYTSDKGHVKKTNTPLYNVLDGKLEFLKMVKGVNDISYLNLHNRFMVLSNLKNMENISKIDLDTVVNAILHKGLDAGMKLYARFKNN